MIDGYLDIMVDEAKKSESASTRIHIEEDAGKLLHDDLNAQVLW